MHRCASNGVTKVQPLGSATTNFELSFAAGETVVAVTVMGDEFVPDVPMVPVDVADGDVIVAA